MAVKRRKSPHRPRKGPFIVIALFLVIWFIGISLDEPVRVLEQAVRICLSCVGIG